MTFTTAPTLTDAYLQTLIARANCTDITTSQRQLQNLLNASGMEGLTAAQLQLAPALQAQGTFLYCIKDVDGRVSFYKDQVSLRDAMITSYLIQLNG